MHIEAEALKSLAARIEGNLLAAAQEIEKLYILKGAAPISAAMIEDYVADSSRFDVFVLLDALLSGELNRAVKILEGLRAEGIAAPVVLWAIARETRTLFNIHSQLQHGGQRDAVFKSFQVWDKRKPLVTAALKRLKSPDLAKILQNCALADQQIKGQAAGDGWESLFAICLQIVSPELGLRTKALRL